MNTKSPAPVRSLPGRAASAGFTLVEIMVVIVILGLLATLVVQNVVGASDEARITKAKADVSTIAGAVKHYRATNGKLPDSLDVLTQKNERGTGNMLDDLPKDPWDHDYELRADGPNDWEVISLGPDGSPGTEDDITSKVTAKDK